MDWSTIQPLLIGLGTSGFRNLVGWAKNSFADGKVVDYEWKQLIITTLSVTSLFVVTYYGLGFDEWMSAGIAFLGDMIFLQLKKAVKTTKKK